MTSGEWSSPLISADLAGSELIQARYVDHVFPRHAHAEAIVGTVLRGGKRSRCGSRELAVSTGATILFHPFEEHESQPEEGGWVYAAVYPSPEAAAWASDDGGDLRFPAALSHDPRLSAGIADLYAAAASGTGSALALQVGLVDILRLAQGGEATASPRDAETRAVRRMIEMLDSDREARLDLGDLAAETRLPRLRVLRAFRRRMGCTPSLYRTACRIRRAKRLLLACRPITDVALDLGFYDQSHFTQVFRRWTGMTPGAYARAADCVRPPTSASCRP